MNWTLGSCRTWAHREPLLRTIQKDSSESLHGLSLGLAIGSALSVSCHATLRVKTSAQGYSVTLPLLLWSCTGEIPIPFTHSGSKLFRTSTLGVQLAEKTNNQREG